MTTPGGADPAGGAQAPAAPLREVVDATLRHYDTNATAFWEGTRDHDVIQNIEALLRHLHGEPPFRILDLGCGPGRDLATFRALGHEAVGLDGSPAFVAMARDHSGCQVWEQDFLALALPPGAFDGIFANASLFHVPARELPRVLRELRAALKPGGVLFSSNPHGHGEEGWNRGRYGSYHDHATWKRHLEAAGFVEVEHYYRPPGLPREQQPWLATVARAVSTAAHSGMSPGPSPAIRLLGIDHVVLRVRDASRMERFYCDVLGCTVEVRRDDLGLVQLRAGRALLDLVDVAGKLGRAGGAAPTHEGRNLDHVCFRVEAFDPDALRRDLEARGVTVGEFGTRFGAEGRGPSLYIDDPEGNVVELKGPPAE